MDEIDIVKARLKSKRRGSVGTGDVPRGKYINNLISRILICFIIFLVVIIVMNVSPEFKSFIKDDILKNNMSFTKISNLYNKYFGKVIPIKEDGLVSKSVFSEKIKYESIKDYKDGYELVVSNNYVVPAIKSGIVVFIGEKEGFGNTVIVQGIDEVDYWYGGVVNLSVGLYDYVSNGTLIGNTASDKLYLLFQSDGKVLSYDEVME